LAIGRGLQRPWAAAAGTLVPEAAERLGSDAMVFVRQSVMGSVLTMGEVLAEIVAVHRGQSLREAGPWMGPFPSGAPAIFIDQVAKLGHPCAIVSCVGDDEFGWMNVERLRADGVGVSAIAVLPDQVTGTAFVRYREDGGRDFVYNIRQSACGHISPTLAADALVASCGHFHVMGSSLYSAGMVDEVMRAIRTVKANGGTVSFDPNIRRELLTTTPQREARAALLNECDIFLPSASEVTALTDADDEAGALREILGLGVGAVVIKRGAMGATYTDGGQTVQGPPFLVEEVDPTGAGDCFAAGYVVSWLAGAGVEESLRVANACGARACGVVGPMEGTSSRAALDTWLATARQGTLQ
jgi:sugar/nucleoside kinase (ribokinase family)